MPEEWFQTLVSYIYKGKGNKNELTSYRPIGLSSAIVNLFKKMWLNRIAPKIMKQMAPNQGEISTGIRDKRTSMDTSRVLRRENGA